MKGSFYDFCYHEDISIGNYFIFLRVDLALGLALLSNFFCLFRVIGIVMSRGKTTTPTQEDGKAEQLHWERR